MRPNLSTAITLAGAKAHRWLQHSRHGTVAAVYQQCLYLADHRNELICLGSRRLGPGPINALCDSEWENTGTLKAGDLWQRQGDLLRVGAQYSFGIGHTTVWRPAPTQCPSDTNAIAANLHRARVFLTHIDAGPLMPLVITNSSPGRSGLEAAFEQRATSGIHALLRWLEDALTDPGSNDSIPEDAVNLIGLGPGLTPSGDDFLGGALVALRALQLDIAADRLAAWIRRRAQALTNDISLAHLSAACDGEALDPIHRALNTLLENRVRDLFPTRRSQKSEKPSLTRLSIDGIEAALARLGAVGHNSGWDAFSGVLAVLEAWQREPGAHPRRDCAWIDLSHNVCRRS